MEEVEIPSSSVFVGDGYAQHKSSEWRGSLCIRHLTIPIPDIHDLPDAIDSAYENGNHVGSRADALCPENLKGSGEADVDVVNLEKKSSGHNDKKNSELLDFSLGLRSTLEEERKQNKNCKLVGCRSVPSSHRMKCQKLFHFISFVVHFWYSERIRVPTLLNRQCCGGE